MTDQRPNPDALLRSMQSQGLAGRRGRLKIFFGACAGVGKTYAMLAAAQEKHADGVTVLIGLVETHGRTETEEMVQGLPHLPRITVDHRGVIVHEFDLDAALNAKPTLILVDELAHTNAPGSRHPKRWMDISELLDAGIDVYTTLNVQHVESLNDVVTRITGIQVRETIPDNVFDSADEVTLVDLPSDDLLERLREGKVYTTDMGRKRAAENFFKRENLLALRELALRRVAERLDSHTDDNGTKRANERLAVCIGPGDLTPKLMRTTKRMADALRASWVAIYVENSRHYRLGHAAQLKLERNIRLAEEMGGKTEILQGEDAATAIANYAISKGITKIVAGKPPKSIWRELMKGSLASQLMRISRGLDVYVVSGEEHVEPLSYQEIKPPLRQWRGYAVGLLLTLLATTCGMVIRESFNSENVIMLYLLAVIILAARYGWAVSMVTSFLSFICFNLFFVQPYYSLTVNSYNDVVTLFLLLGVGFFASLQTSNLQAQSRFFRRKEHNTSALYSMSQELSNIRRREELLAVIKRRLEQAIDGKAALFFPDDHGDLESAIVGGFRAGVREEVVARWVYHHGQPAGLGTNTMPGACGYFVPLSGSSGTFGVLGLMPSLSGHILNPEEKDMIDTFAALAAAAVERVNMAAVAESRKIEAESEKLRNALLSSVSHDLRTPLASIKGVISSLLLDDDRSDAESRRELLTSAHDEVARLERVVGNLLDVTRLEAGEVKLKLDYYFAPELIGNALKQTASLLKQHHITTKIENDLPAIWVDGLLTEQLLINLLENAAKYTPPESSIIISAKRIAPEWIEVAVEDNGPGIPDNQERNIFDKFTTFAVQQNTYGAGLGLTICRAIVQAHGGQIAARNRELGGARFSFTLPVAAEPLLEPAEGHAVK